MNPTSTRAARESRNILPNIEVSSGSEGKQNVEVSIRAKAATNAIDKSNMRTLNTIKGRQRRKVKQRPDAKARAVTVEKKTENLNPDISWISASTASLPGSKRLQPLQPKGAKFKKISTAPSSSLDSGTLQRPTIPTSPKHCSLTAPSSARLPGKHHVNPSFLSVSSLPHQECSISNRSGHPSLPTDHQLSSSATPQFCSTSLSPSYF